MEIYSVNLRIKCECGKVQTRKTPPTRTTTCIISKTGKAAPQYFVEAPQVLIIQEAMLLLDRSLMKSTNGNYQVDIRTKEVQYEKE